MLSPLWSSTWSFFETIGSR